MWEPEEVVKHGRNGENGCLVDFLFSEQPSCKSTKFLAGSTRQATEIILIEIETVGGGKKSRLRNVKFLETQEDLAHNNQL